MPRYFNMPRMRRVKRATQEATKKQFVGFVSGASPKLQGVFGKDFLQVVGKPLHHCAIEICQSLLFVTLMFLLLSNKKHY